MPEIPDDVRERAELALNRIARYRARALRDLDYGLQENSDYRVAHARRRLAEFEAKKRELNELLGRTNP